MFALRRSIRIEPSLLATVTKLDGYRYIWSSERKNKKQNLNRPVNMMLSKAVEVIGGINEGVNLFQWVGSAVSSLRSGWNGKQEQKLQEDEVLQLQSDLECLRDTLPATYHLIDRAEWRGHEKCVAELLPKLKNAVYDAEDILDGFRWYELKLKVEGNATQVSPFIDFFCTVTQGRFNKVIDIQKRLNSISSQLEKMGLCQIAPRFDKLLRPETTSFPTEPKIFGREEEMKKVIKLLGVSANSIRSPSRRKRTRREARSFASSTSLDNNDTRMTNVPVLPIVGIGGVGKTTLAQNICNHQQVKSHFDLIIWTCVSDDFDVKRLTKEAIEQSSESTPATDNLNSLQKALGNSLRKKRFLMVLDDMWDDALKENGQCWKRFCAPFTNVVGGSMMLVTTRFRKVADLVCTMDPVPLEGLKDQLFWDFFKLCIFGFDSSSINPVLECIGKRILPKLKGSPLAAKTLGRLLGSSLDPIHWDRILKSELWELNQEETEILPALRLSYIYLPFHLKRCFSFCAVYPKDFIFEKDNLSEIWVAEGFVEPQGKGGWGVELHGRARLEAPRDKLDGTLGFTAACGCPMWSSRGARKEISLMGQEAAASMPRPRASCATSGTRAAPPVDAPCPLPSALEHCRAQPPQSQLRAAGGGARELVVLNLVVGGGGTCICGELGGRRPCSRSGAKGLFQPQRSSAADGLEAPPLPISFLRAASSPSQ
ncbi:hypothetical protein EJB05_24985, partial [Eragrostis curvula]